jgi:hypothetical protein
MIAPPGSAMGWQGFVIQSSSSQASQLLIVIYLFHSRRRATSLRISLLASSGLQ